MNLVKLTLFDDWAPLELAGPQTMEPKILVLNVNTISPIEPFKEEKNFQLLKSKINTDNGPFYSLLSVEELFEDIRRQTYATSQDYHQEKIKEWVKSGCPSEPLFGEQLEQ